MEVLKSNAFSISSCKSTSLITRKGKIDGEYTAFAQLAFEVESAVEKLHE